jgi:hypothetical protein
VAHEEARVLGGGLDYYNETSAKVAQDGMDIEKTEGLEGQLIGLNERELYAGLAVLASGYKADWIKGIQCEVVPKIKKSSPNSPYLTEESKQACRKVVERTVSADESIRKKALEELRTVFVADYYVEPGRLFLEEFKNKFRESIWGKEGPYDRFKDGLLGSSELPTAIVSNILIKSNLASVYVPLLVYFSLLVVKIDMQVQL